MGEIFTRILGGFLAVAAFVCILMMLFIILSVFGWWLLLAIPIVSISYAVGTYFSAYPNHMEQLNKDIKKIKSIFGVKDET